MNGAKLVCVICSFVCLATGQLLNAQNSATKDPRAISVMNACINASGGSQALIGIQDFVASGSTTFNWNEPTSASSTLKGRIGNQFRFDAALGSGTRSWVVSDGNGGLVDADGSRTAFSRQTGYSLRNLTLPVLDFSVALSDQYAAISYVGLVATDQGPAHQIHIQEVYPKSIDPAGLLSEPLSRDYFIDPHSFLLIETKDNQSSSIGSQQTYVHDLQFSGFESINGLTIPLSVTERVGGQQTWSLRLSVVTFNVGLADSDFEF